MALLATSVRLSLVGVGAIVAVLPITSGACGRSACFEYSASEYAATNGCPSQAFALSEFTNPSCAGPVVSVDSAGTFEDGELCCYAVSVNDVDPSGLGGNCQGPGGGGAGGIGGSTDFGGSTTFSASVAIASVSSGVGGSAPVGSGGTGGFSTTSSGGGSGCVSCSDVLAEGSVFATQLCPQAQAFWGTLSSCACAGVCESACETSFCDGATAGGSCEMCLEDTSSSGCGTALLGCEDN